MYVCFYYFLASEELNLYINAACVLIRLIKLLLPLCDNKRKVHCEAVNLVFNSCFLFISDRHVSHCETVVSRHRKSV